MYRGTPPGNKAGFSVFLFVIFLGTLPRLVKNGRIIE